MNPYEQNTPPPDLELLLPGLRSCRLSYYDLYNYICSMLASKGSIFGAQTYASLLVILSDGDSYDQFVRKELEHPLIESLRQSYIYEIDFNKSKRGSVTISKRYLNNTTTELKLFMSILRAGNCCSIKTAKISTYWNSLQTWLPALTEIASKSLVELSFITNVNRNKLPSVMNYIVNSFPSLYKLDLRTDYETYLSLCKVLFFFNNNLTKQHLRSMIEWNLKPTASILPQCNLSVLHIDMDVVPNRCLVFDDIFKYLPNLKELKLTGWFGCGRAKELYQQLLQHCPKLSVVNYRYRSPVGGLIASYSGGPPLGISFGNATDTELLTVFKLFTQSESPQLLEFNIEGEPAYLSKEHINAIWSLFGDRFCSIKLASADKLILDRMASIKFPRLRSLDVILRKWNEHPLNEFYQVFDERSKWMDILKTMPNLQEFKVRGVRSARESAINALQNICPRLTRDNIKLER